MMYKNITTPYSPQGMTPEMLKEQADYFQRSQEREASGQKYQEEQFRMNEFLRMISEMIKRQKEEERAQEQERVRKAQELMSMGAGTHNVGDFDRSIAPAARQYGVDDVRLAQLRQGISSRERFQAIRDEQRRARERANVGGYAPPSGGQDLQSMAARGFYQTPYSYQNI